MSPPTGGVLLTGATGFVGSHVAEALVGAGRRVRCTVRRSSDTRWIDPLDVERVELDLRDPAGISVALREVDAVVHVAGLTRAPDEATYRAVNAEGTGKLAASAARHGVRRFVFVSSLAARGPDGAPGPASPYGRSKREGERRLGAVAGDMETVVLRPAAVYGPRDTDLLPLFRMAGRGWLVAPAGAGGLQPVYATDLAEAVRAALEAPAPGVAEPIAVAEAGLYDWEAVRAGLAAALGRGVRLIRLPPAVFETAGMVAETLARLVGRTAPVDRRRARDIARHVYTCDPRPAEEKLGWTARVSLPDGLDRTVRWYRAAGWLRGKGGR